MTYLDLKLEEYLEWLHQKGVLAVQEDGRLKYLILCKPLTGTHVAFDVPQEHPWRPASITTATPWRPVPLKIAENGGIAKSGALRGRMAGRESAA